MEKKSAKTERLLSPTDSQILGVLAIHSGIPNIDVISKLTNLAVSRLSVSLSFLKTLGYIHLGRMLPDLQHGTLLFNEDSNGNCFKITAQARYEAFLKICKFNEQEAEKRMRIQYGADWKSMV